MKRCPKCGETSDDSFDSCWRCSTSLDGAAVGVTAEVVAERNLARRRVEFKIFRGTFATWNSLCAEAAEFASSVGRENLITISHSEDKDDGVVVVWFWSDEA